MDYFYGDPHFGHFNCIDFDNRPFNTVEEMDLTLIEKYNAKVTNKDDVYIMGDFYLGKTYPPEWYLGQLNGKKHLIIGNHDFKMLKNSKAMSYFDSAEGILCLNYKSRFVVLCHYPIIDWNRMYRGSYHIYSHVHTIVNEDTLHMMKKERALNAGCMINNYEPVTFEELVFNNEKYKNKILKESVHNNESV